MLTPDQIDSVLKKCFSGEVIIDVDCSDSNHCDKFATCRECLLKEFEQALEG